MKTFAFLCLFLILTGCNSGTAPAPEAIPGLSKTQLVPTLEKIAQTGEYFDVLQDLTIGLENNNYMNEAVAVQGFQELSDPEAVKKAAAKIAKSIQK